MVNRQYSTQYSSAKYKVWIVDKMQYNKQGAIDYLLQSAFGSLLREC